MASVQSKIDRELARNDSDELISVPASALTREGFVAWKKSGGCPDFCTITLERGHLQIVDVPDHASPIRIPKTAATVDGFTQWAISPAFPGRGRISYIDGEIIVDMSPEELNTHNPVKGEVSYVLYGLNKKLDLGVFYGDRALVKNDAANLSNEPDASLVSWASLQAGRVRVVPRKRKQGFVNHLFGAPDWVLEVVSDKSVKKDTETLWTRYYLAGIPEYWLIDARGEQIHFTIFLAGENEYIPAPRRGPWQQSRVFQRRFKLERTAHPLGPWLYTLHVKMP
ncbi:MAG: Uma2 family endonuclease [Gemmataceae bacterium]|nr:Uma2 family endonuclease [Gemmataceae bacterium]